MNYIVRRLKKLPGSLTVGAGLILASLSAFSQPVYTQTDMQSFAGIPYVVGLGPMLGPVTQGPAYSLQTSGDTSVALAGTSSRYTSDTVFAPGYDGGGVLVGVSGQLQLADTSSAYLYTQLGSGQTFAYRTAVLGQITVGSFNSTASTMLVSDQSLNNDAVSGYVGGSRLNWQPVTMFTSDPAALASFVGNQINVAITSQFDITTQSGGKVASINTRLTAGTDPSTNAGLTLLGGDTSLGVATTGDLFYYELGHAAATFADGQTNPIYLDTDEGQTSTTLQVTNAGGFFDTVGMELREIQCTGACDQLHASFVDGVIGAGQSGGLTVTYDGPANQFVQAKFTVVFQDDSRVGAEATRGITSLSLLVNTGAVNAVPEPHSAALLLAGLGAIGWMSRRRRAGERQVAKL